MCSGIRRRHRCRIARHPQGEFHNRKTREAASQPQGFGGMVCCGDGAEIGCGGQVSLAGRALREERIADDDTKWRDVKQVRAAN